MLESWVSRPRRSASTEPEAADLRVPVRRVSIRSQVLVGVPEGAVVGIERQAAVVAPPGAMTLGNRFGAATLDDTALAFQRAGWIPWHAARVANRRVDRVARCAVTNGNVAGAVHRDAAHPPKHVTRCVSALLIDDWILVRPQLVPPHSMPAVDDDGMIHDQCFVIAEIAVREPKHRAVPDGLEWSARTGLWNGVGRH